MNRRRVIAMALVAFCLAADEAQAARIPMWFGEDEEIHEIEKLPDSDYILCYKTTTKYYMAGIYIKDDGYALRRQHDDVSYWPLDAEKIAELQEQEVLPNPLPSYSISWGSYAKGYSAWIILALLLASPLFKRAWDRFLDS